MARSNGFVPPEVTKMLRQLSRRYAVRLRDTRKDATTICMAARRQPSRRLATKLMQVCNYMNGPDPSPRQIAEMSRFIYE